MEQLIKKQISPRASTANRRNEKSIVMFKLPGFIHVYTIQTKSLMRYGESNVAFKKTLNQLYRRTNLLLYFY